MALTPAQQNARLHGIGGSECAIALGLSKRKTALQLYLEKRGELARDNADDEVMWWGRMLEPIVRQKYAEKTGRIVRLPPDTIISTDYDFMLAHVDGVSEAANGGDFRGYEGKTAFHSTGWGEEGTDQIPEEYLLQVQHYLIVTKLPVFDVANLCGRKFSFYEVHPDKELHEMIIEGERDFMRRVREGDPPSLDYEHPSALDVLKKLYPGTNGQRLMASDDAQRWRAQMENAAVEEKVAKSAKEGFKARILEEMGEAALLAFPDGKCMRRQKTERAGYAVEATSFIDARLIKDPEAKGTRRK